MQVQRRGPPMRLTSPIADAGANRTGNTADDIRKVNTAVSNLLAQRLRQNKAVQSESIVTIAKCAFGSPDLLARVLKQGVCGAIAAVLERFPEDAEMKRHAYAAFANFARKKTEGPTLLLQAGVAQLLITGSRCSGPDGGQKEARLAIACLCAAAGTAGKDENRSLAERVALVDAGTCPILVEVAEGAFEN